MFRITNTEYRPPGRRSAAEYEGCGEENISPSLPLPSLLVELPSAKVQEVHQFRPPHTPLRSVPGGQHQSTTRDVHLLEVMILLFFSESENNVSAIHYPIAYAKVREVRPFRIPLSSLLVPGGHYQPITHYIHLEMIYWRFCLEP